MNAYLSRLNPVERRFVIGVGLLFFAVINLFWVRPHFADWGNLKSRLASSRQKQANYQAMIQQIPTLKASIAALGGDNDVPPEDQAIRFLQTIQSVGFESGVAFNFPSRQNTSSNQFFLEQSQAISVSASEKQIVDFLYNIGAGGSQIRARAMSLRPDPNHFSLNANITLVASYQRKPRTAPARTTPAPTPAKPAATATPKPTPTSLRPTTPLVRPTGQTSAPPAKPSGSRAGTLPRKK